MTFSTFTYNLTRAPYQFKTLTKLLTALLGRKCCHVVWAEFRRCRTSFLWHMERASRQCWPLCFKLLSNDSVTVLYRVPLLSRANTAHLQLSISAAFCQLPGSKEAGLGWGYKLSIALFLAFLSYFWVGGCACVCVPAAEPVLNSVFSVFQELHDQNAKNHSSVLRYFIPALNLSMRHSWVLGLSTYLIKAWGGIRRNN